MERAATGSLSPTPSLDRSTPVVHGSREEPGGSLAEEARAAGRLLAALPVVHLRVEARTEAAIDAAFTGSLIRGALGAAVHRLACRRPFTPCEGCDLLQGCLFPPLFGPIEGPVGAEAPSGTPIEATGPAPGAGDGPRGAPARLFALVPPERIAPGPVSFDLKLFGPSPETLRLVLEGLHEMGRAGIGRERVPLPLVRIASLGPDGREAAEVGSAEGRLALEAARPFAASDLAPAERAGGEEVGAASGGTASLRLDLLTPLRMKEAGRLAGGLGPERLLRAALRRLTDLGNALGEEWPRAWPGTLSAARGIEVIEERLRFADQGRYSLRQGRAMRLGGMTGRVEYGRVPRVLLPVLRAASFAQLGKNATFGLGVTRLEVLP